MTEREIRRLDDARDPDRVPIQWAMILHAARRGYPCPIDLDPIERTRCDLDRLLICCPESRE